MPRKKIFRNVRSVKVYKFSRRENHYDRALEVRIGDNWKIVGFSRSENELLSFEESMSEATRLETEVSAEVRSQRASGPMGFSKLFEHSLLFAGFLFVVLSLKPPNPKF